MQVSIAPHLRETLGCRHLFGMEAQITAALDAGDGPLGRRIWNSPGEGGVFAGERMRGRIAHGGGDWMLVRRDGVMEVDARLALVTNDEAVIHMRYGGRIRIPPERLAEARDPDRRGLMGAEAYYFRTTPVFETGDPRYLWLADIVAVGIGRLLPGRGVAYEVYELL